MNPRDFGGQTCGQLMLFGRMSLLNNDKDNEEISPMSSVLSKNSFRPEIYGQTCTRPVV